MKPHSAFLLVAQQLVHNLNAPSGKQRAKDGLHCISQQFHIKPGNVSEISSREIDKPKAYQRRMRFVVLDSKGKQHSQERTRRDKRKGPVCQFKLNVIGSTTNASLLFIFN